MQIGEGWGEGGEGGRRAGYGKEESTQKWWAVYYEQGASDKSCVCVCVCLFGWLGKISEQKLEATNTWHFIYVGRLTN